MVNLDSFKRFLAIDPRKARWIPLPGDTPRDDNLDQTTRDARDTLLTTLMNASAQKVLDALGNQTDYADTTALLGNTDSPLLDTAILLVGSELFDLADFFSVVSTTQSESDFVNESLQKKMSSYDLDAMSKKIQSLISASGKRGLEPWLGKTATR